LIPVGILCTTIVASNQLALDPLGMPHAADIRKTTPSEILDIFERAVRALREVRTLAAALPEESLQLRAEEIYRKEKVFLPDVVQQLSAQRLADLPKGGQ
jgi:hypothetical protein